MTGHAVAVPVCFSLFNSSNDFFFHFIGNEMPYFLSVSNISAILTGSLLTLQLWTVTPSTAIVFLDHDRCACWWHSSLAQRLRKRWNLCLTFSNVNIFGSSYRSVLNGFRDIVVLHSTSKGTSKALKMSRKTPSWEDCMLLNVNCLLQGYSENSLDLRL